MKPTLKQLPYNPSAGICDVFVESEREDGLNTLLDEADQWSDEWSFFVALYYTVQTVTTIGFGDIYIFSPEGSALHIGPIVSVLLTAFIIALFAKVFSKFQADVERSAEKKTQRARNSVVSMQLGVIRVNQAVRQELQEIEEEIEETVEETKA